MRKPALILAGASGVGKNTVAEAILKTENSPFSYTRSLTTRAPRDTFTDEYLYVSEEEFLSRVRLGKMLEHTCYGGKYYGTPMSEVERVRAEGKIPLMILDINGVESIRCDHPAFSGYAVYLYAEPSEIRRRLEMRDLSDATVENRKRIEERLKANREDFRSLADGRIRLFDAFVENRLVENTVAEILKLYEAQAPASEASVRLMCDFLARAVKYEFK